MNKPLDKAMGKLIQMLHGAYFVLVDGEDTDVDVDELIGNLGEFLALWDGDESAFSCEEDKTPELVALVNKLKEMEDDEAEIEKFVFNPHTTGTKFVAPVSLKRADDLLKGDK